MSSTEFIQVFGWFLLIIFSSSLLGLNIISLIAKLLRDKLVVKRYPIELVGAALLVGIGAIGYASLFLGIAGFFTKPVLSLLIALSILVSAKQLIPLFKSVAFNLRELFSEYKSNLPSFVALLISIGIVGSLYLAAMQPPHTSDELHYHLPEVKQIVENQRVDLAFGGHLFYGNIPKLMEIIFAVGKTLSSYQLSHALNFAVFLGLLIVVFGFVKKYYGITAASISILFLSFYDDLTWNATAGFIDAATTAFEVSSLLFILIWVSGRKKIYFYLSAILIGIAVSMKYSPLPTAVFILGLITFKLVREHRSNLTNILRHVFPYALTAFIFGGFWYIKNLIKTGNPFYPLYFGHRGYDEAQFKSLVDAIHEFGPKTPEHFFDITSRYLNPNGIFVFLSIYLAPVILFIRKQNVFRFYLFSYFSLYTIYWFLIATHQIRFLMTAIVISTIILAIMLSKISSRILVLCASLLLLFLFSNRPLWNSFWNSKFHLVERQYALGNVNQTQFLTWQFGCQYSVIKYLEDNNLEGAVIDNWSVWFAPSVSFYAEKNAFQSISFDTKKPVAYLMQNLERDDIRFIYYNTKVKDAFLASKDPLVIENKSTKLPAETLLLSKAKLIFKSDTCLLYEIKY